MEKLQDLKNYTRQLNLGGLAANLEEITGAAQQNQISYLDFATQLVLAEINHRQAKDLQKRLKTAKIPLNCCLETYDYNVSNGMSKQQLNSLKELLWLEQNFNLIIMGPAGIGKTFIAAGLCKMAVNKGYKAYFRTMEQLLDILKLKDITKTAMYQYNCLLKSQLLVIDDIMMFPLEKPLAVKLFNLINNLHQKASFVVTTNKNPEQWAKMLDDEVLATAILDRLLYKCEIIKLNGSSYRMNNRKSFFDEKNL